MGEGHRYIPASEADRASMLREIGVSGIEDLFATIPVDLRLRTPLTLAPALSEQELLAEMSRRTLESRQPDPGAQFLGGGAYRHHTPALVDHLISRTEFYSSYTPYQPEISQGTLQAIFEFQTLICQLTELEISNASMYDGASALAEAILMAERMTHGGRVVVSDRLHPEYLRVCRTHLANLDIKLTVFGARPDGSADPEGARRALREGTACAVVVQHPNFFGCLEEIEALASVAREADAHLIVAVTEPVALGLLKGPGKQGADIVVGEGQSFGVPLSFGGPYLGFMAARQSFLRNMPGRIVGETRDADGRRGYVLTLSTREQHIRREKATSNICTNEGLCALIASIFLAVAGRAGLRELATHNHAKASYARRRLAAPRGLSLPYTAPSFNEFTVRLPVPAEQAVRVLLGRGLVAGIPLSRYFPEMERDLLVCVTETNPRAEIDRLADELGRLA
jgi:glycine cleavage system P protein (glycine dehydrogenase) subunit 1